MCLRVLLYEPKNDPMGWWIPPQQHAFFCIVSCWQCVENYEGLVKLCNFHCIGGGSVPPPMSCQTLGRAMHQKARHLAWTEARIAFFCVVSCWQCVKSCEGLIKLRGFHCIGVGNVPPPMSCQTLGRTMRQKAHRLAWAEACMQFSVSFLVCNAWENVLHRYKSSGNVV